ncbi:MAG: hypothetical protein F6K10_05765 [Moorea sp. SIO2B7]|nr:hypothetical protein [Moorena sp. SIO2B7]
MGVFFAGGTLTDVGNKKVEELLDKREIPRHFHSGITLIGAIILTFGFWGIQKLGVSILEENYKKEAREYLNKNDFYQSIEKHKKIKIINPDLEILFLYRRSRKQNTG